MNRKEFLDTLIMGLQDYSKEEIKQYTDYYNEMIDDRMEEGLSEEEAVADIGAPEEAVNQIKSENPLPKSHKKDSAPKVWQIVLIAVGSPIWLSLLVAAVSIIFSLVITIFSVIISLYASAVALGAVGIAGVIALIPLLIQSNVAGGIMLVGLGLISTGLCILSFMGLNKLLKWLIPLLKKLLLKLISRLKRKEDVQ